MDSKLALKLVKKRTLKNLSMVIGSHSSVVPHSIRHCQWQAPSLPLGTNVAMVWGDPFT